MGWHVVGKHQYYYRSIRVNGKPVRHYIGKGRIGELAAATADVRRLECAIKARELMAEKDRFQRADAPLNELCDITDVLTRAVLTVAGYHQHDRGEWRQCREDDPISGS